MFKIYASFLISLLIYSSAHAAETFVPLREKVAKMLILGFEGTSLTKDHPIIDSIQKHKISGIIIFEKNLSKNQKKQSAKDTLRELIADIKKLTDQTLFISVDQEGGRVNRLKEKYGFRKMLSQKEVGYKNNRDFARKQAQIIAEEVASVGFNVNFSPAVDIDINENSPAIGKIERSFANDPKKVTELAQIYIEEYHKKGLLTTLKHFPGHGSATDDSHYHFTDISDTWHEKELYPYKELIKKGLADTVMISHLYHSQIDAVHPATMSEKAIVALLRNELNFDGVVISDDMQMKGLISRYGIDESIVLGINAGMDLFIYGNNLGEEVVTAQRFVDTVMKAVERNEIKESQINASYERIEKLRARIQN